jgi:NhaA family Na+:H+ antiporter
LPLFAFANAGVVLTGVNLDMLFNPITLGIVLGLFVGKQIGIFGACWLAIKLKIASLPEGASWKQLYGVTILCGIGFTMSLFIGSLAFEGANPAYFDQVKLGVLIASLFSAVFGAWILNSSQKLKKESK